MIFCVKSNNNFLRDRRAAADALGWKVNIWEREKISIYWARLWRVLEWEVIIMTHTIIIE